jgi:transposase
MVIIGVDYHPSDQYIAFADTETGECGERRLNHSDGEAQKFYRELAVRGVSVRVGMEATGYSRWFERLLAELGIEVWIGDAAEIKTKRVRKQKTDRNDAQLLLKLLLENNFPKIWVPNPENRDLRQLLWHRHRLVQMRTRIMNQLQALAMNEGQRRKKKLWSEQGRAQLEKLPLATWASRRRKDLLELLDRMNPPHRRVNPSRRARSQETARRVAADDSPWRRSTDGAGLRADHWNSGAVQVRQADRQLCRTDPV